MTTFGSDGHKLGVAGGAAPAEEQLTPPVAFLPDEKPVNIEADDVDQDRLAATISDIAQDDDGEEPVRLPKGVEDDVIDVLEKTTPPPDTTVVALADRFDVTQAGEQWQHDRLEFKGDLLGIRLPARQALAAFSLATSKYVSLGIQNDLTGLFIARHLSPESYGRVFSRLMDPDEDDYDVDTVGELFNAIVTASLEADKAAEEAKKAEDAKKADGAAG